MKHLIDIESISKEDILNIVNLAKEFKKGTKKANRHLQAQVLVLFSSKTASGPGYPGSRRFPCPRQ